MPSPTCRAPGLPGMCMLCRRWRGSLCTECVARWARPRPRCARCALPVAVPTDACGECLRRPPEFDAAVARCDYGFPWDHLIGALKFGQRPELAGPLAEAMAGGLPGVDGVDLLVPVPLSQRRLAERGYNQAWELARQLGRRLGRAARADLLLRLRDTPAQSGLKRAERERNLRDAFWIEPGRAAALHGRHVGLVDDVMTSGATAEAAARVLRRAGAARVQVWVLARTPAP